MPPKADKNDYFSQANLGASAANAQFVPIPVELAAPSSGGRKPGVDSLSGLRALPELRAIPWVPGKELPPEKSTDSPRTQTRGAFLLSTRGNINNPPCSHCATGSGRFMLCVSLDDFFHGACSTCQMATRGNLCSLRTGKDDDESPSISRSIELEPSRTPTLNNYNQPESSLKRKRSPPPPATIPQNSQLQARNNYSNYIQPGQGSPSGFTASNIPNPNRVIGGGQAPTSSNNYGYQVDKTSNWQERVTPSYQTQGNLGQGRGAVATQTQNNYGGQYSAPTNSYNGGRLGGNQDQAREETHSMSPSTQLLQAPPERQPLAEPIPPNYRQGTSPFTPLIDTLPRIKQKRIFGIIGGIQSGIRTVRQQTENLQRQLDLLQAEMGIDTEDDNGDG